MTTPGLVVWLDAICMPGESGKSEPLEIAMVVCSGPEMHELAAITLPVDHEREVVQSWYSQLPAKEQQRHRKSGLMQEVVSNGLMVPMVMEALAQTLDRVAEPGRVTLAAERPERMRSMVPRLVRGFGRSEYDLSLTALRQWGLLLPDAPDPTDWGPLSKPARALDHCLGLVDEARQYLALLGSGE